MYHNRKVIFLEAVNIKKKYYITNSIRVSGDVLFILFLGLSYGHYFSSEVIYIDSNSKYQVEIHKAG